MCGIYGVALFVRKTACQTYIFESSSNKKKRSLIDGKSQKFGFYWFMIRTGAPTPRRKTTTTTSDINAQYNPFFLRKSGFGFSILKKNTLAWNKKYLAKKINIENKNDKNVLSRFDNFIPSLSNLKKIVVYVDSVLLSWLKRWYL